MKTVFQKIIDGEIPSMPVYRDDKCIAIKDISPQAPVHILLIPIKTKPRLSLATQEDAELLAHLMLTAPKIAKEQGLQDGFRIVVNNGIIAGETVPHLHIHILGGRQMAWPPG